MKIFPASMAWTSISAGAYLWLALIGVSAMGCTPRTDPSFHFGQRVFQTNCVGCHGAKGEGVLHRKSVLNNNTFVTGSPDQVVETILFGREGPPPMPGWQNKLNDQEVAAVATYIRQAWSNHSDPVTIAMVAKIRNHK
jgi:alcohol dehydrogenase (quinone), cytochrome c subunit